MVVTLPDFSLQKPFCRLLVAVGFLGFSGTIVSQSNTPDSDSLGVHKKESFQEKKILYAFACPNHHNTVTRLKWLTALTADPKAKRWMLGLARKMENEVEEHWYPCFYQQLRMEMAKYYEAKKYLRMVEKSTDFEEDFYGEAV